MARNDMVTFEEFIKDVYDGVHGDLSAATIKAMIVDDTITPTAADATPRYADYSANEVSAAGGYTTGGLTLSGVTTSEADGVLTFDDTGNITISKDAVNGFEDGYWLILYNDTAAADQAICFLDLGGPVSEKAGEITITWNASGIFTDTVTV